MKQVRPLSKQGIGVAIDAYLLVVIFDNLIKIVQTLTKLVRIHSNNKLKISMMCPIQLSYLILY